jgi:hypothetical protein
MEDPQGCQEQGLVDHKEVLDGWVGGCGRAAGCDPFICPRQHDAGYNKLAYALGPPNVLLPACAVYRGSQAQQQLQQGSQ